MIGMAYNFNEFCRAKECKHFADIKMQVGRCITCSIGTSKITFNILKIAENCPHMEDIKKAKHEAKKKDMMWKKLLEPEKSLKRINNMPVYIDVF